MGSTAQDIQDLREQMAALRAENAQLRSRLRRVEELLAGQSPEPADDGEDVVRHLDREDREMLQDAKFMAHVEAAREAHRRAEAGEDVDWDAVIGDHIVG